MPVESNMEASMNENAEILKKVEALLKGNESIEVDMNDPAISGLVSTLRRAFVRNDLAKNGIAVDFPSQGSLMRVYKFGSPAGIKPTKVPVAKVGTPDDDTKPKKSPAIKRSQHSYVPPKIADDLMSVLTDEASHVMADRPDSMREKYAGSLYQRQDESEDVSNQLPWRYGFRSVLRREDRDDRYCNEAECYRLSEGYRRTGHDRRTGCTGQRSRFSCDSLH